MLCMIVLMFFPFVFFSAIPKRFRSATTVKDLEKLACKTYARNTESQITWALNMFRDWKAWRLSDGVDERITRTEFTGLGDSRAALRKVDVAYCLRCLICEVKKSNGSDYPGRTLYHMVLMLQFALEKEGISWKLLSDPEFKGVRNTLDNIMKERCRRGIGRENPSLPATLEILNRLWECGALCVDTPDGLRDSLTVLVGYHFALRGGVELRSMRFPGFKCQLSVIVDENGEEVLRCEMDLQSKTSQGGMSTKGVPKKPKVVLAHGCHSPERSILFLFKEYVRRCPAGSSAFWRRAKPGVDPADEIWYTNQPVGKNTLGKTIARIFRSAGIPGKYTNQSLRSGAATTLYHHGVDEQTIKEITGHTSDAVRKYKRPDAQVVSDAGRILAGLPPRPRLVGPASTEDGVRESSRNEGDASVSAQVCESSRGAPLLPVLPRPDDEFYAAGDGSRPGMIRETPSGLGSSSSLPCGGERPIDVKASASASACASRPSVEIECDSPYNVDGSLKAGHGVSSELLESVPPASRYLISSSNPAPVERGRFSVASGVNLRHGRPIGAALPVNQPPITSFMPRALDGPIQVLDAEGNLLGHVEHSVQGDGQSGPRSAETVVGAAFEGAVDRTLEGRQPKRMRLTVDFD